MIIDNINLNHFRIFEAVYRLKSMTKAAQQLHMTQSGVSQHIKVLEDLLETHLFDRIKQRLIPTESANGLFRVCSKNLIELESELAKITGKTQELCGEVTIGLPIEFGNNLILPRLAKFGKDNPQVNYQIRYGYASDMNDLLLAGEIDFAFLDDYTVDKLIETVEVFHESLVLCCSKEYYKTYLKSELNKKTFESLDYIAYLDGAPVIRSWFKQNYRLTNINLNIRAHLMDVNGMARMIEEGLGIGVLPVHQLNHGPINKKKIHIFEGAGKPVRNAISIASVKGKTHTRTTKALIEYLKAELLSNINIT